MLHFLIENTLFGYEIHHGRRVNKDTMGRTIDHPSNNIKRTISSFNHLCMFKGNTWFKLRLRLNSRLGVFNMVNNMIGFFKYIIINNMCSRRRGLRNSIGRVRW